MKVNIINLTFPPNLVLLSYYYFLSKPSVLNEDLPVRALLELLLDERARRKLTLRQKSNGEVFRLYEDELKPLVWKSSLLTARIIN